MVDCLIGFTRSVKTVYLYYVMMGIKSGLNQLSGQKDQELRVNDYRVSSCILPFLLLY